MKVAGLLFRHPVRLAAVFLVLVFLGLVARFWHPTYGFTRFLQLDASNDAVKIDAFRTEPVYVYRDTGGYDGLYYAQIAYDPSLRDPQLAPAMDNLSYRGRRILPSALAWLLAAGQPAWIAQVYSLLNVVAWLATAWALWRLLAVADWRGFAAWAGVLFSAGALGSVRLALTDLIALAFLALGFLAAEQGRLCRGSGLLAAAALSRETSLLALAGLVRPPWFSRANLGRILLATLPLAGWLIYLRWQLGASDPGWGNFALPFAGFIGKWRANFAAIAAAGPGETGPAWATLAATLGLTVQAAFLIRHPRWKESWWRVGAVYTGLMFCLGPAVWLGFPGAATRVLLPLTLAFNVLAARSRASAGWFLAGNLSVFSGLIMMTDVHHDPRELAAARGQGAAIVARVEEGWYGVERSDRHVWSWSSGHSRLAVETWPHDRRELSLDFVLRSLKPVTVSISQNGVPRWQGSVGPEPIAITFPASTDQGWARLEFSADAPGAREDAGLGGRTLAFAIYDLRPKVSQPLR